jgi:hypothetical protein
VCYNNGVVIRKAIIIKASMKRPGRKKRRVKVQVVKKEKIGSKIKVLD